MKRFFFCLISVCLVCVCLSAKNKPIAISTSGSTGEYSSDVIRTEKISVAFNQGAKTSYVYSLKWTFVSNDGQTLSSGEWTGKHEWGAKTNRQTFTITMPTSDLPDFQADRTISFRCALIYQGSEVDYCTGKFDLRGRRAEIQNAYFIEGERHCRISYSLNDKTITPRVDLYINGQCAIADYQSGQLFSLKDVGSALGHVPSFHESFEWQLRAVDPLFKHVLHSTRTQTGHFAPFEVGYQHTLYSYSADKLTVKLEGAYVRNAADWTDARFYAELRDEQNKVIETSIDGKKVKAEGRYSNYSGYVNPSVNFSIPLHVVAGYRNTNKYFQATLYLYVYYDNQWETLGTQKISFEKPDIKHETYFHTDHPLFNQHNGPVILFFTMSRCGPAYVWKKKIYEPRINQWRAWGVKFLYCDLGLDATTYFPDEQAIADNIVKPIREMGNIHSAPSTLVFDGFGNCVFKQVGFKTAAPNHPEYDNLDELLQSIAEASGAIPIIAMPKPVESTTTTSASTTTTKQETEAERLLSELKKEADAISSFCDLLRNKTDKELENFWFWFAALEEEPNL